MYIASADLKSGWNPLAEHKFQFRPHLLVLVYLNDDLCNGRHRLQTASHAVPDQACIGATRGIALFFGRSYAHRIRLVVYDRRFGLHYHVREG